MPLPTEIVSAYKTAIKRFIKYTETVLSPVKKIKVKVPIKNEIQRTVMKLLRFMELNSVSKVSFIKGRKKNYSLKGRFSVLNRKNHRKGWFNFIEIYEYFSLFQL